MRRDSRNIEQVHEINKVIEGDVDPVEATGCQIQNDAVLLCYAETKDWRKCQKELEAFKQCMDQYVKSENINKS